MGSGHGRARDWSRGRRVEEGFHVLACDDGAAADFEVGQPPGAHLVIEQVPGQPGDQGGFVDRVGPAAPLTRL